MTDRTGTPSRDLERSFLSMLAEDVDVAEELCASNDTQSNRRHLIRTTFAMIEGSVWLCREHVRDMVRGMGELTPLIDMALSERTYTVTGQGDVVEQVRFVTLRATIRLMVKQAQRIVPELDIDFGDAGWNGLADAITIRNRTTHPKTVVDLDVRSSDVETVRASLLWTLVLTTRVMGATLEAQAQHTRDFRHLLDALKHGDANALRAYRHAFNQQNADDV